MERTECNAQLVRGKRNKDVDKLSLKVRFGLRHRILQAIDLGQRYQQLCQIQGPRGSD